MCGYTSKPDKRAKNHSKQHDKLFMKLIQA